jgi:AbiV family abortive infection protein
LNPPHKADIPWLSSNVRFWGFGAHILILQEFSTLPLCYPHTYPLAEFAGRFRRHGFHRGSIEDFGVTFFVGQYTEQTTLIASRGKDVPVTPQFILEGAVYSLEQSGLLLRDATILYKNGAYASAIMLAMFAQEGIGQFNVLVDLWRKARAGEQFTVDQIRDACKDHMTKQEAGMVSLTLRADRGSGVDKILRARIENPPQSPEWKQAGAELEKLDKAKTKRTPTDRHDKRVAALYVDPITDNRWNRPTLKFSAAEADALLQEVVNDYSGRYHNCYLAPGGSNENLKLDQRDLHDAFEKWSGRPTLEPPPMP